MPTFLVTKEMTPALAARVRASVSGRRSGGPNGRRRPITAMLRMVTFTLVVTAIAALAHHRHRTASELEVARKSLAHTIRLEASALAPADREILTRVQAAISTQASPAYAGDWFAEDLHDELRFTEALKLPTLYVRGPLEGLAQPENLSRLAVVSGKDAFVLCLLDPPGARTEKALKAKARLANAPGTGAQVTASVERVAPLFLGLPLLSADWARRAESAETRVALDRLRKAFEAAPIHAAVRAAKTRQLLAVLDEAGDPKAITELDGERPHPVRVTLTDLSSGKVRLRFRGEVDPSWISANTRAEYASRIDSCALAMDLRRAALGQRTVLASD